MNNQPTFVGSGVTGTVHFANSDAALTTDQISSYQSNLGVTNSPLIQIPYVVTPITIPVINGPAVTSTTTPQTTPGQAHSVALNDNDLCGIFSGKLTNWNRVLNPEIGSAYALSAPIKIIYRADGSGTTELLTRQLATVSTTANTAGGVTFVDGLTFTSSFPSGVPSNFIAAYGDGGVRNSLSSLASAGIAAIGYLSPSYTNKYLAPSSTVVTPSMALQIPVASLVNTVDSRYYAPTYTNASITLDRYYPPAAKLVASRQWNRVQREGLQPRHRQCGSLLRYGDRSLRRSKTASKPSKKVTSLKNPGRSSSG